MTATPPRERIRKGRRIDRKLIKNKGHRFWWWRALLCPCTRLGQVQDTCPKCNDRGYLLRNQKPISVLNFSDSRKGGYNFEGEMEQGSSSGTCDAHLEIGHNDRLASRDWEIRDNLILTRSTDSTIKRDWLKAPWVTQLSIVSDGSIDYDKDQDYRIYQEEVGDITETWVEWIDGGRAPAAGEQYTVMFLSRPVWMVNNHPRLRAFGPKAKDQLPLNLSLVRDDLVVRRSQESPS